jgi:DNA-directed RNA polymerase II subunit RPB1
MTAFSQIDKIQFSIIGDEDVDIYSRAQVINEELFVGQTPVRGGLYSPEMGSSDNSIACDTCGEYSRKCISHFGCIKLNYPIKSPLFIREIGRWLKVTCKDCGYPIVDPDDYQNIKKSKRLTVASQAAHSTSGKTIVCKNSNCGKVQPKIEKDTDDHISFSAVYEDGSVYKLHNHDIKNILNKITIENAVKFGYSVNSHPRKLILSKILVPPVGIRPSIKSADLAVDASYHDIVRLWQYICKKNLSIPSKISYPIGTDDIKKIMNMEYLYYESINGSSSAMESGTGKRSLLVGNRKAPSIRSRIIKKTGRIRGNLLGKRVWYISRTTIAGNPTLHPEDVMVPASYASILSKRDVSLEINKSKTKQYLTALESPKISRIIKKSGEVFDASKFREENLEDGDSYLRDLDEDEEDQLLLNRQPSLEESALGAHNIKVAKDEKIKTYQFNVIACKWYGADFDGDQMPGIAPRNIMARIETKLLSSVHNRFISPKNSGPVNGQVQDSIVGCYKLTKNGVRMDRYHAMAMYSLLGQNAPILPIPEMKLLSSSTTTSTDPTHSIIYSGRDIISGLLKKYPITLTAKPSFYNENFDKVINYDPADIKVVINGNKLISGVLDKKTVGEGANGGVSHIVARDYGMKVGLDSTYEIQQVALRFLANKGFTAGLHDLILPADIRGSIRDEISGLLKEANNVNEQLIAGELLPPIGMTIHEFYEKLMMSTLKESDLVLRYILKGLNTETNGMYEMPAIGAKGNWPNLKHIMAFIGQIDINQERIGENFSFRRTSPYHPRFSLDPRTYGFVENNYIGGLRVDQFVFAVMNGRYDLINKALSTSITGYQMRKSVAGLQSCVIDYYRRVCIDTKIIEGLYGDDGLDPRFVENVKFPAVNMDNRELEENYKFAASLAFEHIFDEEFKRIRADRDYYRKVFLTFEKINFDRMMTDVHILPVNTARIVENIMVKNRNQGYEIKNDEKTIAQMCEKVNDFTIRKLPYVLINEIQEKYQTEIPKRLSAATSLLAMSIRCELSSKKVLGKITPVQLDMILAEIRKKYSEALIDCGAGVGFSASQAICEPLTQYMLDSHHRSIAGGTNKSGITRVKEILGARPVSEEQSPEMLFRVWPEYEKDPIKVREIANNIELLTFNRFIKNNPIKLFEQYGTLVYPPLVAEDSTWVKEFEELNPLIRPPGDLTSWCIWIELDKSMLLLKGIELERIVEKLRAEHPDIFLIHNSENMPKIKLRIYIRSTYFDKGVITEAKIDKLIAEILNTPIRGIDGIQNINVVQINRQKVNPETGGIEKDTVYAIKTVGTNIYGVALNKYVDPYSIVSSSIGDTYKMFGIEAARQKIISELRVTVESSRTSLRHIMIYADVMTCTSKVTNLEKSGLEKREKNNIFLNSALMDPIKAMKNAAITGTVNKMYGAAAPLMIGSIPRLGTAYCDIIVNKEFVKANMKSIDKSLDELR